MHTVCSSDTLHVVIMGNKHSSLECQLVFFSRSNLFFNEKIMWFFTFFQQYTSKTPKVQCMRACVLPFSWYSLQVSFDDKRKNKHTHITYKYIYITAQTCLGIAKRQFTVILFWYIFIYVAICLFLHLPSWSHQFAIRVVWHTEEWKKTTTRLRSTFFHI